MANQLHVARLLRVGVPSWNRWRREKPNTKPDLSGADLSGAFLRGANLSETDLRGTRLIRADLIGASFRNANLCKADFVSATLLTADFSGADLSDANLYQADLRGANLYAANLDRAYLREANLRGANFFQTKLRETILFEANLNDAHLRRADLTGAELSGASCLRTDFEGATLADCNVYGISAWDVELKDAVQADLRIAPEQKSLITVDNLEVAQFLYLLLHNEKMRAVLDTITSKMVLILGRFSDERKPILDALREALRSHPNGYIPVLFDFEPQTDKPVLETVKILANLARFIIADLTDPHMVRAELTALTMSTQSVPIQPIIHGDDDLPTEYESWALARLFLPVYRYIDLPQLLASLNESVITPIETHVHARRL